MPAEGKFQIVASMTQTVETRTVKIRMDRTVMLILKTLHVLASAFLALASFMGLLSIELLISILPVKMQRCITHVIMGHRGRIE